MLSGTDEPGCHEHPSAVVPAVDTSMSGADRPARCRRRSRHRLTTRRIGSDKSPGACHHSPIGQWRGHGPVHGRLDRGELEGWLSHGFRNLSARGQLRPNVCRSRGGADAGRRGGLARAGRRTPFGGQLVSIGGFGIDRRVVAGPRVGVDERGGRVVRGMAQATAAQAEETGAQAKSAAAAYQTAFTSTVPPPMVAANRSQLMTLIATNLFGRNTQAIAANEAQYGRDVGPGRRGDVRLRSFLGIRDPAVAVHPATAKHQPRRPGRPGRRGHPSHRHGRR